MLPLKKIPVLRRLRPRDRTRYARETFETLAGLRRWSPEDLIIDVGANDGRSILRWRRHLGPTRVLAFEPVSVTFDVLREATAAMKGVRLMRCALGDAPGELPIHLHAIASLNSFRPGAECAHHATEIVPVAVLDTVLEREGVARAALLKVDAEGFDLEVLRGAERALAAQRFDIVQVEAGFDAPGPAMTRLAEVQALLAPHRYFLHRITNQSSAPLARLENRAAGESEPEVLVYCDAIFVRG